MEIFNHERYAYKNCKKALSYEILSTDKTGVAYRNILLTTLPLGFCKLSPICLQNILRIYMLCILLSSYTRWYCSWNVPHLDKAHFEHVLQHTNSYPNTNIIVY